MKYQIGEYSLDTHTRTLSLEGKNKHVRPKTLTLLLFLAHRHGQIISKQTLLDSVWDDVQVDDGVIFQSVREIRQLFDNPQILLNHPRKGYEFTAECVPLTEEVTPENLVSPTPEATSKQALRVSGSTVIVLIIAIVAFSFLWQHLKKQPPTAASDESNITHRILVLPIENHIPYGDHSWLHLGGMEQLISRLDGLPQSSLVFTADYVPRLMSMAGITRDNNSGDKNGKRTDNINIRKLSRLSGASIVIQIQARGNAADYKLLYRFHKPQAIKQGVVVTDNFEDGFEQIAQKLASELQQPLDQSPGKPQQEFSDALFAQAMLSYETDWETSISFFESYLSLNPGSTIAAIYLSKLYLWQKQPAKATSTIQRAAENNDNTHSQQAEISLIQGRIAAQQQQWQLAEQHFQTAMQTTRPYSDWLLKASIAEEHGLSYMAQNTPEKAIAPFQKALEYYHITQSPIGINAVSLHLAGAYFEVGETQKGTALFEEAKGNIESQRIDFLQSMLAEYSDSIVKYRD